MSNAIKPIKYRCKVCNKKIPLVMRDAPCQCGYHFCSLHRLPETHDCEINSREKHLENAAAKIASMKCVAVKLEKI